MLNATASTGSNFSYQWTTTGGHLVSGITSLSPIVDAPGLYQLAVTNSTNGCSSIATVVVDENTTPPVVDAGAPASLTCTTQVLSLMGTASGAGNLTFQWTTTTGHLGNDATTLHPQVNQAGSYLLTATNPANGCTATDQVTVGIDTLHPVISANVGSPLNCVALTTILNAAVTTPTSGFTTDWTTTNGHFNGPQNLLSVIADAPGLYQVTVQTTANGCSSTAQTTVVQDVMPPIAKIVAPDTLTCDHPTIALNGTASSVGTSFGYLWTASNGGQIQGGETTLMPTVTAAGTYELLVTNLTNGCKASIATTVARNVAVPTVVILLPQTLTCTQSSVVLNAGGSSSGPTFSNIWTSSPAGHIVSGQTTLTSTVDQAGTYLLTIKNTENGCIAMAQTSVTKNITPPLAEAGPDAALHCQQTEVTLQGSSTTSGSLAFAWSTANGHLQSGGQTATPVINAAGTYSLTVTNTNNGCTATDATTVTEIPLPEFVPTLFAPDCFDPTGDVDFGPVMGGTAPFRYSTDGGLTFSNSPTYDNLSLGLHNLVVEDQHGCRTTQSVNVQIPFLPTVTLTNVFTLQQGDSVRLEPVLNLPLSSIATWQWTPAEGLSCTDCPRPWAKPLATTTYSLSISDLNGCVAAAKTLFRVDRKRYVYAPNVFSPNGDGENDRFLLYGKGVKEVRALRIYDRWGAELFLAEHINVNDESAGWSGDFHGKSLNPAVFVWQAAVEFLDGGVEIFTGDVTIVR